MRVLWKARLKIELRTGLSEGQESGNLKVASQARAAVHMVERDEDEKSFKTTVDEHDGSGRRGGCADDVG
jgi:hypothetical protein